MASLVFVACEKDEAFKSTLKIGSKDFDVIGRDYGSRPDTSARPAITKKGPGTSYTGGTTIGDSTYARTR